MFQGGSANEKRNTEPFPFDAASIDFVLLSHAHIDHSGRLPLLVKRGFRGEIYCSDATASLLGVMLKDAAFIQEKDTEWVNKKALRAGRPAIEPLYTVEDAEEALKLVRPVMYSQLKEPIPNVKFVLNDAGHLFGSAVVELWVPESDGSTKIVFSGDLGRSGQPMLDDPTIIKKADYVIMESTYGNRLHEEEHDSVKKLSNILLDTTSRGGTVVIPSFAVGRTQELIYEINGFFEHDPEFRERMKNVKVYIDSPMAVAATEVFKENAQVFDEEFKRLVLSGDDPLHFENLVYTKTTAESTALNIDESPKIIISASGMCEAGRIRHHLKHNLWKSGASIVFVGYQGEGTLGRKLLDGAKQVTLFGEEVYVNAKIHNLEGFSGHADRDGLLSWAKGFQVKPASFFLVHGELQSKKDLAETIREATGISPIVVEAVSEYDLTNKRVTSDERVMEEIMDAETIEKMHGRITNIKRSLEEMLYKADLSATDANAPAALSVLNEKLLALEKDTLGLASFISDNPVD
jgi:metallo-beta-lactamase family protein